MARNWTRGDVLSSELSRCSAGERPRLGYGGRRMELAVPMAEPREPSIIEREVHELTPSCCGSVSGKVADEGATCLVLVDVDTG